MEAEREGHIQKAPRYNAVSDFLNEGATTKLLRDLVRKSATPLASIEDTFAVDSTGFACRTYGSYLHFRYRKEGFKAEWIKLHACIGVRFNIITDAIALDGHSADSPQFEGLVKGTAKTFEIGDVTADKAYGSKLNHWIVKELGGEAVIPFKSGKSQPDPDDMESGAWHGVPGIGGSAKLWRRAYHYFSLNQEEFYKRYHKRSNVEATFSALKATLGERLKSKTKRAQQNEVMCKAIAWNIRCVVRAMTEIGIDPVFYGGHSSRVFAMEHGFDPNPIES